MRNITAQYTHNYVFKVPSGVDLWSNERAESCDYDLSDNDGVYYFSNAPDVSPVGYWWVKWATLFYIDEERRCQEIQGDDSDFSTKWHDLIIEDSDEDEEEDDSE